MLSNQPQGGFVTRRPTADDYVESDNDGFGSFFQPSWNPQTDNQPVNPRRRGGGQSYQQVPPRWW